MSKGAKQDHQKQQQHTCGVSKGAKQDHQKQQQHTCGVSKGTKQDPLVLKQNSRHRLRSHMSEGGEP